MKKCQVLFRLTIFSPVKNFQNFKISEKTHGKTWKTWKVGKQKNRSDESPTLEKLTCGKYPLKWEISNELGINRMEVIRA